LFAWTFPSFPSFLPSLVLSGWTDGWLAPRNFGLKPRRGLIVRPSGARVDGMPWLGSHRVGVVSWAVEYVCSS
jgi:hypothetical protein